VAGRAPGQRVEALGIDRHRAHRLLRRQREQVPGAAIGTPGIHSIPDPRRGTFTPVGQQLFDEKTLQEVAGIGNGQFYMAQNLSSLSDVFATIDKLEKTKIEHRKITETEELFSWPLAVSAGALFLGLLLSLTVLHSAPEPAVT
jgi:Ca-activated chloride channel family protein